MSAASDALMKSLADLSAKLSTSVSDIEAARAQAEAAQAAKDDATFAQANEQVKTMLANLGPHVEAIGQLASAVADGAGTSAVATPPVSTILDAPAETPVQAGPALVTVDVAGGATVVAPAARRLE